MIRELVLRRFKRFEDERIDLHGHVVLAGPNNCGKTTMLQAIAAWGLAWRHYRAVHERRSAATIESSRTFISRPGGHYPWAPIARQAFTAVPLGSFDLLWTHRRYEGSLEIEVEFEDGTRVGFEFQSDTTEQVRIRPMREVSADVLLRDLPRIAYLSTVSGLSLEEPEYRQEYIETALARQRPGDVLRNLLLVASQGAHWDALCTAMDELFGLELQIPASHGGILIAEYRQGGVLYDIQSAGSGVLQVLHLLACLAQGDSAVILVDEPDAHLHVFLQDSILHQLQRAAARSSSQLIIATHSEVIFDSAQPEQLCQVLGHPTRLTERVDVERLKNAVRHLRQSEVLAAGLAPGILYLDGYTDLNLLREWARVLGHPLATFLTRTPLHRTKQSPVRPDGSEVSHQKHYEAMLLANPDLPGVWLLDSDAKLHGIPQSSTHRPGVLSRLVWSRYEIESYLLHPPALARFLEAKIGGGGGATVRTFFTSQFGSEDMAAQFFADPLSPPPLVEQFLRTTKARTELLGNLFIDAGMHGFHYTRFHEIAAQMLPEEVHPEVREKLDFIQQAFGL